MDPKLRADKLRRALLIGAFAGFSSYVWDVYLSVWSAERALIGRDGLYLVHVAVNVLCFRLIFRYPFRKT